MKIKSVFSTFLMFAILLSCLFVSPFSVDVQGSAGTIQLLKGESIMLSAFSNYAGVFWTSSDSSTASVTDYGLVTAHTQGNVTITACIQSAGNTQSRSWSLTISNTPIFSPGTYIIEDSSRTYALSVEGPSFSNGAEIIASPLNGENYQKWNFIQSSDGYYRISSLYSGRCVRVLNDSPYSDSNIIQYQSNGSAGMKWSFLRAASGNHIIIPQSSDFSYVVMGTTIGFGGTDVKTIAPSSASEGSCEWVISRCLPTNGEETAFDRYWGGENYSLFNCFQYVLNCQSRPWNPSSPFVFMQPGDYSHTSVAGYNTNPSLIVNAVERDVSFFDTDYGPGYIFEPIGRYDECPEGSIKVALVISSDDYHWYKQDSDGLWSHKQGQLPVSRYDISGHLIIDPQTAERGGYQTFVGYFALTPWNIIYSAEGSMSSQISGELYYTMFVLPSESYCGRPVFIYKLEDGSRLRWETDRGCFYRVTEEKETLISTAEGNEILHRLYEKEMFEKSFGKTK
ncbi:MAG: RICIN domain-containing protein [Clostridia bacterium]|nr:RICIN domain-containing protein [Clostridia bacterium]